MFKRFNADTDLSNSTQVKASVVRGLKKNLLEHYKGLTEEVVDALLPKKSPLIQYKVVGQHQTVLYCRRRTKKQVRRQKRLSPDNDGTVEEFYNEDDHDDNDGDHDDNDGGGDGDGDDDDDDVGGSAIDEPFFFQQRDGPVIPTLKVVHRYYPSLNLTRVQVDRGAIPFVLGGANVMCPGLTKKSGSYLPPDSDDGFVPALNVGDPVVIFAEGKQHAIAIGTMTMASTEIRSKNKGVGIELLHFLGDGLYQTDEI